MVYTLVKSNEGVDENKYYLDKINKKMELEGKIKNLNN